MNSRELYINDILCDLPDATPVAITFQINDLANLEDRQSTYTNSVKLPKTHTNCRALGYPNIDAFTQNEPYENLTCKYVENGVEIIPYGSAIIQSVSDFFEVQILYGVSGLNDIYDGVSIQSLSFLEYSHPFDVTGVANSQAATEGFLWPVIDMGVLTDEAKIDINYLRPAFYTKTILRKIAELAGYTFSGNIFFSSLFQSELITALQTDAPHFIADGPNLPDIKIKDFLKDFMQRYFLTPDVDNYAKTVRFRSLDELYDNIPNAKDWTEKFINDARTDNFTLPGYAQKNELVYKETDTVTVDVKGEVLVDNKTIEGSRELFKSPFSGSDNKSGLMGGLTLAYANIKDDSDTGHTQQTTPRVLYNKINPGSGLFQFYNGSDSVLTTGISIPYFYSDTLPGLKYSELIERYGQGLVKMLKKARVVTRYAILDEYDVYNFDYFTPVFDKNDGKYYYVNQIVNWQPHKKVKVNLIRL